MGVYISIVAGAIKLLNYIAAALQQRHDEMNGRLQQTAADQSANAKADENAAIIQDGNARLDHDALVAKLREQTGVRP